MVALISFLFLCLRCGFSVNLFRPSSTVVGSLTDIPDGWIQGDKPGPNEILKLHLVMHQPAMADIQQRLIDVSTPGNPLYGQHLEKHEVNDLLQPSNDTASTITKWLESEGVTPENIKYQGHWILFDVSVLQAERLLSTEFHEYHRGNITVVRTLQYSVPSRLRSLIATLQPTTRFGQPRAQAKDILEARDTPQIPFNSQILLSTYNASFCNTTMTPACIRGIYNMGDFQADPKGNTLMGVSGFDEEGVYLQDVEDFIEITGTKGQPLNLTVFSIDNGVAANGNTGINHTLEGNLDVEYAVSLARGTPVVYYSTGGRAPMIADLDQPTPSMNGTNEPYLDQLTYLLGLNNADLPDVLITSYAEDEQSVPYDYANEVCDKFSLLGLRGVSVIFASGDTGVGSACQSNDGKKTPKFAPNFPATCPYVTSVGGTYALNPEIAAAFTSGGFSNYFPAPPYQLGTMKDYWAKLGNKNKGYFNTSGRGYPDVSAQSVRYLVYNQGHPVFVYGTSCAAPTFAAIISNINNIRRAQGKPKLGFLNPWLYSEGAQAFNDITLGHSRGCAGHDIFTGQPAPKIDNASWDAIPGWDPVTGWGTPDFAKLRDMLATTGGRMEDS